MNIKPQTQKLILHSTRPHTMELPLMKRGDVYYADLDPTVGCKIQKRRPVLIVSNNANNKTSTTITVVPLTSNTKKVYSFEVLLDEKDTGLPKTCKAQCHQVRTVSVLRIKSSQPLATIDSALMHKINYALKIHLAM